MFARRIVLIALIALCALSISTSLRGAMGELEKPHISLSIDYPKADQEKLQAVLNRTDCKYLGGAWLNRSTALRYGGDTIALNKFIEALSLCPNLKVHVNFFHGKNSAQSDWMVTHMAPSNELVVRINLDSTNIDMEKLYLPPVKAEEEKKP